MTDMLRSQICSSGVHGVDAELAFVEARSVVDKNGVVEVATRVDEKREPVPAVHCSVTINENLNDTQICARRQRTRAFIDRLASVYVGIAYKVMVYVAMADTVMANIVMADICVLNKARVVGVTMRVNKDREPVPAVHCYIIVDTIVTKTQIVRVGKDRGLSSTVSRLRIRLLPTKTVVYVAMATAADIGMSEKKCR